MYNYTYGYPAIVIPATEMSETEFLLLKKFLDSILSSATSTIYLTAWDRMVFFFYPPSSEIVSKPNDLTFIISDAKDQTILYKLKTYDSKSLRGNARFVKVWG